MGKPGRPALPEDQKCAKCTIGLEPETMVTARRLAEARGETVYAFLTQIVERVLWNPEIPYLENPCYGGRSSTLSAVLSGSATSRSASDAEPSSPR